MAFFSSWTERAETGLRLCSACFLMLVLLIFNVIAISYPFSGVIRAPFFLMAIYYWSIYRPTLVPSWFVFIAGSLIDLLSGLPLGLNALIFVLTQWIVADQRRFLMGQSFLMIWVGFAVVSAIAGGVQWTVFGLINGASWPSLLPAAFSVFSGIVIFPVISLLLHLSHKILPAPRPLFTLKAQS